MFTMATINYHQNFFKNHLRHFRQFRNLSKQVQSIQDLSDQSTNDKNLNDNDKSKKKSVDKTKFDPSLIPQYARDNFLIEFNKKVPTYDQLYEYQIDQKLYNRTKFINESRFLSVDFKVKMTKKYDLSFDEFTRWLRNVVDKSETKLQSYNPRRHGILGPDLAASNFFLSRGGKVRFKHQPDRWVVDLNKIPKTFDKKYRVISIDASELNIIFEGLDNLIMLSELEELNLAGNPHLDDWACDKLARLFRNSTRLIYLNLSDIPRLSHRGVEALHKIASLKTLVIKRTKASNYQFIELLVLMFNEINPNCKIIYQ